jgi:hypothetical protein
VINPIANSAAAGLKERKEEVQWGPGTACQLAHLHPMGLPADRSLGEMFAFVRNIWRELLGGEEEGVATCSVAGCSRNTWNGQPGQQCCRTCRDSNGRSHGPDCDRTAGHLQASLAPGVGSAALARPAVPSAAPAGLATGLP